VSRFWLLGSGTMIGAACVGLLLGGYATTTPRGTGMSGASDYEAMLAEGEGPGAGASASGDLGLTMAPTMPVVCKGCGPTLADRRFAADMAGLDADSYVTGSTDAIVQDYLTDDPPPPVDLLEQVEARPAPVVQVAPLPPAVVRIARGGQLTERAPMPEPNVDAGVATAPVATMQ